MPSPFSRNKTRHCPAGKWLLDNILHSRHLSRANHDRLINVLKAAKQDVPEDLMKFGTTVKKKQHDAYGAFFKDVDTDKKATKITFDD
jgi:hypothetical protein